MTVSKHALAARRQGVDVSQPTTVLGAWRAALLEMLEAEHRIAFPDARYQNDPLAFFREIIGVEPWARARDLINAVRIYDRVAVKAGRKVAKSHTLAGLALWFYCSFPDARVVMTSTTSRQVDAVLWRELSMMRARSGRCVACKAADPNMIRIPRPCPHSALIDGEIGLLARTGLKSDDFREIFGFTAKEGEAVQGISGTRLLYIVDEASGIPDAIYEAIEGNRAGGAKVVLSGNPTKTTGEFFDAFHTKALDQQKDGDEATGYHGITISSEQSPNIVERREVVRGLATLEWLRERQKEWGVGSPLYRIHVLGEFATNEDGKIFSVDRITEAEARWATTEAEGRLFVGIDPAGATGMGDESCFAARRGLKMINAVRGAPEDAPALLCKRGLDEDGHLAELLRLLEWRAARREVPVVVMDRSGKIGAELYGKLLAHVHEHERRHGFAPFEVVGVRSSDRAVRQPFVYDTIRDELAASLEVAFRDGLALIEDVKLSAELHVLEWRQHANARLKITPKDEIRKALGRSPDRYDAVALAFWDPLALQGSAVPDTAPSEGRARAKGRAFEDDEDDGHAERAEDRANPYGGRR